MADDGLVLILAGLEEVPPVRPAFASSLRDQLRRELGFAVSPIVAPPESLPAAEPVVGAPEGVEHVGALRRLLESLRPVTPRVVLVAALALLLVACTVAATVLVLRAWLSSGPRGAQYTDDFAFAEVFREVGTFYTDLQLAPDGRSIVALRQPRAIDPADEDPADAAVVRFDLGESLSSPRSVFPLERLRDPVYWDPGVDIEAASIGTCPAMAAGDSMAVAANGDVFTSVCPYETWPPSTPPTTASLVVIHPDGSAQAVLRAGELVEADQLDGHDAVPFSIVGVPSATDRLWVRAEAPVTDGPAGNAWWLFQVVDPTHDGDWSDRIVRRLVLPTSVPAVEYAVYDRFYGAFVAEPTTATRDRSRSILLPVMERTGRYRIYRIADEDEDGDATDPGETELVFDGEAGPDAISLQQAPVLEPRLWMDGDRAVVDELVVAGLARATRVSRITPDGVIDIVRALPSSVDGIVTGPDASIFIATQEPGDPWSYVVYRLTPIAEGTATAAPSASGSGASSGASASTLPSPSASSPSAPRESPLVELAPLTQGVPRIAAWVMADDGVRGEALLVGVDGTGPADLVPGVHTQAFCQSADGSLMGYWSDEEVPNEPGLYVANADGTAPRKISETATNFWCRFPGDAMLLLRGQERALTIVRHDLTSDTETELVKSVLPLASSPDGRRLAVATGPDEGSLQILDTTSGALEQAGGPYDGHVLAGSWSSDGERLAFIVGPFDPLKPVQSGRFQVSVVDADGAIRQVAAVDGQMPTVAWSSDSRRLIVRTPTHDTHDAEAAGDLVVVDLGAGTTTMVGEGDVIFAGWSPVEPDTYAYATPDALFVATIGGGPRKIADVPSGPLCPDCEDGPVSRWPGGDWMGWSPDGGYIGLGTFSAVVGVVEVASGEVRVVMTDRPQVMLLDVKWWR